MADTNAPRRRLAKQRQHSHQPVTTLLLTTNSSASRAMRRLHNPVAPCFCDLAFLTYIYRVCFTRFTVQFHLVHFLAQLIGFLSI
jgi:hypothetical protein